MKKIYLIPFLLFLTGCLTTTFYGSPKIQGGRIKCEEICKNWDLELAGMVALGDYTDGCICKVKESSLSINEAGEAVLNSAGGLGGGSNGVYMQMQREQPQQQQNMHFNQIHLR